MTFEEWWTENERDLKDIAEFAWFAATQAERELAKKVLNSQSEAHIRNLQAAVEAEREACAVACETEGKSWRGEQDITDFRLCAAVIRARSTKP